MRNGWDVALGATNARDGTHDVGVFDFAAVAVPGKREGYECWPLRVPEQHVRNACVTGVVGVERLMKTLIITEDRNFGGALPGLALLVDPAENVSIQSGDPSEADLDGRDIAVVDGRTDLVAARNWCALLRAAAPSLPVLVVADQSALVAIDERWCVDDVVVPGLSPAELDMRMRLAVKRHGGSEAAEGEIVLGDLVLDLDSHAARLANRPLNLTPIEFRLMRYLASHPGKAFTRSQLLHEVWDSDDLVAMRTINVHVQRLRAKLGPGNDHLIDTVRGVGYMAVSPRDISERRIQSSHSAHADTARRQKHSRTDEHILAG
jgi:DNA-binding response OmpR family regulator